MPKPSTVLEALEFAQEGKYIFDWNDYTPEDFTIQLGLRKKDCIEYVSQLNGVDTYKITKFGKEHLNNYRNRKSSAKRLLI